MLRDAHDANSRCRPMRRLRRVVADVGREPGFGATLPRGCGFPSRQGRFSLASAVASRHGWAASMRRETPRSPAPPLKRGRAVSRLADQLGQAPIGIRCGPPCLAGRLPGHRHYSDAALLRLAAPTSASADNAAFAAVDAAQNSTCHESRTKNLFSRILAASGPNADFAACHYPFSHAPSGFHQGSDRRHRQPTDRPLSPAWLAETQAALHAVHQQRQRP